MSSFLEERFCTEGRIWSDAPSLIVPLVINLFKKAGVHEQILSYTMT
ncbi:MAG: hypothetical protein WAK10_04975 [Methanoregula sp.]